ncbi:MAG TPA: hypothetical protein VNM48_18770, partial [Chloroflexota bacterium]|nr:hypothetical protein [Chloroflexota bacterium]
IPIGPLDGIAVPWSATLSGGTVTGAWTPRGVNMKPLAPVVLSADKKEDGTWSIVWARRDRKSENWNGGALEVPASENPLWFRVLMHDAAGEARAFQLPGFPGNTTPFLNWTVAQQTAGFGGEQAVLRLSIRQIATNGKEGYETGILTFP